VDGEFFPPGLQATAHISISRLLSEQLLVGGDRLIEVAAGVFDVAEQLLRLRELRIELQRSFQRSLRIILVAEKMCRNARAEIDHVVVRPRSERLLKQ